jgi:hypothetical protein
METAVLDKKVEAKKQEKKCFWEIDSVDAEGNILIKVFNKAKQDELNALVGTAKARYTRAFNKTKQQDDRYAQLVEELGFDPTDADMYELGAKAFIYNMQRERKKDAKAEQNKQALLDGAASARAGRQPKEPKAEKQTMVITEEGEW